MVWLGSGGNTFQYLADLRGRCLSEAQSGRASPQLRFVSPVIFSPAAFGAMRVNSVSRRSLRSHLREERLLAAPVATAAPIEADSAQGPGADGGRPGACVSA